MRKDSPASLVTTAVGAPLLLVELVSPAGVAGNAPARYARVVRAAVELLAVGVAAAEEIDIDVDVDVEVQIEAEKAEDIGLEADLGVDVDSDEVPVDGDPVGAGLVVAAPAPAANGVPLVALAAGRRTLLHFMYTGRVGEDGGGAGCDAGGGSEGEESSGELHGGG